jgi:hypothetical protein
MEQGLVIISCDFCGCDWDEVQPMIEGHKGSVLCLDCLKLALHHAQPSDEPFDCTLCLQQHTVGTRAWRNAQADPSPGLNPAAALCWDCVRLAAKTFTKDPDVPWRWDPADYPKE